MKGIFNLLKTFCTALYIVILGGSLGISVGLLVIAFLQPFNNNSMHEFGVFWYFVTWFIAGIILFAKMVQKDWEKDD